MAKSLFAFPGTKAQFKSLKMQLHSNKDVKKKNDNLILTIPIVTAISNMLKIKLLGRSAFQIPNLWSANFFSFRLAKWK